MPYQFWSLVDEADEREQFKQAVEAWGGVDQLSPRPDVSRLGDTSIPDYEDLTCEDMRDRFIARVLNEDDLFAVPSEHELFRAEATRMLAEEDAIEMARWIGQAECDALRRKPVHYFSAADPKVVLDDADRTTEEFVVAKDWAAHKACLEPEESNLQGENLATWVPEFRKWMGAVHATA